MWSHRPLEGKLSNCLSGNERFSTRAIGNVFIKWVPLEGKLLTLKFCTSLSQKVLLAAPGEESDISLFAFLKLVYFLLNNFGLIIQECCVIKHLFSSYSVVLLILSSPFFCPPRAAEATLGQGMATCYENVND